MNDIAAVGSLTEQRPSREATSELHQILAVIPLSVVLLNIAAFSTPLLAAEAGATVGILAAIRRVYFLVSIAAGLLFLAGNLRLARFRLPEVLAVVWIVGLLVQVVLERPGVVLMVAMKTSEAALIFALLVEHEPMGHRASVRIGQTMAGLTCVTAVLSVVPAVSGSPIAGLALLATDALSWSVLAAVTMRWAYSTR